MTTLKELNQLARECGVCAMNDDRSINKHLNECDTCSDYNQRMENFNKNLEEIRKIALKDNDARHRLLFERFTKIANLEDEERVTALSDILDATSILPESDRVNMVKARTDILTDFPKYERDPIMSTFSEIAKDWRKDRKLVEKNALIKATDDYPILKRMMVHNIFEKILE